MSGRFGFAWCAIVLLAGCGSVRLNEVVLRAPSAARGPVPIHLLGKEPSRPFYDVALLQAIGQGSRGTVDDVMQELAKRAGELGCDAVVRADVQQGGAAAHASGVCVRYVAGAAD